MTPLRASLLVAGTGVGLTLLVSFRTPPSAPAAATAPPAPAGSVRPTPASTPGASPSGAAGASPTPAAGGSGLRNGTFTGQNAANFFGPVQVQVVVSGGRITDLRTLQQPNDNPQSSYIASVAMPMLRQEVLKAQSARINIITGATYDSESYAQSVQSALDQAHA